MRKIVIDTKGADQGGEMMIKGAALAVASQPDLSVLLVGDTDFIRTECEKHEMPMDRVEILEAPEEITNYDDPADAVFHKTESSMLRGLLTLSQQDQLIGMITAGNTGVLIASCVRYLSRKERVRPALAAVLPNQDGSFTCLVDTGATIDCPAATLLHFAQLGTEFMRDTYRIESPRVGLLSNGAEETKGNKAVKEAHQLLKNAESINFVGNVEGNIALTGVCDVLVCDGFAGNQVLKVTEGTATRMITDIVKYAKRNQSAEIMELVGHLMGVYDIGSLGGGIILGCSKPVIKIRGNAGEAAVVNTAQMLLNIYDNKQIFDSAKNYI